LKAGIFFCFEGSTKTMQKANNNTQKKSSNSNGKKADASVQQQAPDGVKLGMNGRRTWDKSYFEQKAAELGISEEDFGHQITNKKAASDQEQQKAKILPASQRTALQARKGDILSSIEKQVVGKRTKIQDPSSGADDDDDEDNDKPTVTSGGIIKKKRGAFHCEKCNVSFKDSNSLLDHYNSRQHVLASGMTMQAERASVDSIRKRLAIPPPASKATKSQQQAAVNNKRKFDEAALIDAEEEESAEAASDAKRARSTTTAAVVEEPKKQQKAEEPAKKKEDEEEEEEGNDAMMKMLGFSGFSSKQQKK